MHPTVRGRPPERSTRSVPLCAARAISQRVRDLTTVVETTMQPAHIAVWLRTPRSRCPIIRCAPTTAVQWRRDVRALWEARTSCDDGTTSPTSTDAHCEPAPTRLRKRVISSWSSRLSSPLVCGPGRRGSSCRAVGRPTRAPAARGSSCRTVGCPIRAAAARGSSCRTVGCPSSATTRRGVVAERDGVCDNANTPRSVTVTAVATMSAQTTMDRDRLTPRSSVPAIIGPSRWAEPVRLSHRQDRMDAVSLDHRGAHPSQACSPRCSDIRAASWVRFFRPCLLRMFDT